MRNRPATRTLRDVAAGVNLLKSRPQMAKGPTDDRYRLLIESITDYAIYMLDTDGRITSWNPGARRFKGYEADEIIGENFARFYTEEDRARGLPPEPSVGPERPLSA